MDPALKKRLIGATVLIVLAIIFLPMLFDGRAKPVAGDSVQMDIPDQPQRDFETRVVPLNLPAIGASGSVADAIGSPASPTVPLPSAADTSLTTAPQQIDAPVAAVAAPAAQRVDAVSGDAVGGSAVAGAGVTAAPAPEVVTTPPAASAVSPASAVAAVANPAAPVVAAAPPESSAGRFVVNIGSYANTANAAQIVSSLRAAGLTVRSEAVTVDGKTAQRLRLGPYASRALAENARLKAKSVRADVPSSVSEIDDTPAADVPARNTTRGGASAFAVQVAVLSDAANSTTRRDELRKAGFAAFVEKLDTDKGATYRLRVGPESDRSNAEKIRAALKQRFGGEPIIVDYP